MRKTIEIAIKQCGGADETMKRALERARQFHPEGTNFVGAWSWAMEGGRNYQTGQLERNVGINVSFDISE